MFRLAICDDDTLHMQNTLRCTRETPEAADCDIRTFSAPGELMDAVTGGGYRPHIALLDICMPDSSGIELAQRLQLAGFLVRKLEGTPALEDSRYFCVAVRTREDNEKLVAALREIVVGC